MSTIEQRRYTAADRAILELLDGDADYLHRFRLL
jgi:hypothetical protein